ncbi:hypothetical protein SAMD00023353_4800360 [Rosellinia necatrix]|uniref:Uncharacterized protein n=1 Tax=Rosellinia necatrix TaxID=77044 RepID=A0A1W2TQC7_ROSNE|nr:hypothetical protein SAMD00023353_4800360 [Rosellinia necatrix]
MYHPNSPSEHQPRDYPQEHLQAHPIIPPPPPNNMLPIDLRGGPSIQISDVSPDLLSESDMRDELTDFVVFRYEKMHRNTFDEHGQLKKHTWDDAIVIKDRTISKQTAAKNIRDLNRETLSVREKKDSLVLPLIHRIDSTMERLTSQEPDPARFHWTLAQIHCEPEPLGAYYPDQLSHHIVRPLKHWRLARLVSLNKRTHAESKRGGLFAPGYLTAYFQRVTKPGVDIRLLFQEKRKSLERIYQPHAGDMGHGLHPKPQQALHNQVQGQQNGPGDRQGPQPPWFPHQNPNRNLEERALLGCPRPEGHKIGLEEITVTGAPPNPKPDARTGTNPVSDAATSAWINSYATMPTGKLGRAKTASSGEGIDDTDSSDLDSIMFPRKLAMVKTASLDEEMDDSDNSDLDSIMSVAPSLTSSISSVGEASSSAIAGLKSLLLHHSELEPLYHIAIFRVGPEKLQRNLRRLILQYGRALHKEAANSVQVQAARFVRSSSARIAAGIKEDIITNSSTSWDGTPAGRQLLEGYLKDLEQGAENEEYHLSSDEESSDDRDTLSLQTLEGVKNFMLSTAAFAEFCYEFKYWLKLENRLNDDLDYGEGDKPEPGVSSWQATDGSGIGAREGVDAKLPSLTNVACAQESLGSQGKLPSRGHGGGRGISLRQIGWIDSVFGKFNALRNMLSDHIQPKVAPGYVRVSWKCRCGKRLRIEIPNNRQAAGIAFAQQASGPSNVDSVSCSTSDVDNFSSNSSDSQASVGRGLSQSGSPPPSSPLTAPSINNNTTSNQFIPSGTKMFMLLCVNTGIRRIGLANVDVTDAVDDEEIFKRLQREYRNLCSQRGRNPLIKPKMMYYIKVVSPYS